MIGQQDKTRTKNVRFSCTRKCKRSSTNILRRITLQKPSYSLQRIFTWLWPCTSTSVTNISSLQERLLLFQNSGEARMRFWKRLTNTSLRYCYGPPRWCSGKFLTFRRQVNVISENLNTSLWLWKIQRNPSLIKPKNSSTFIQIILNSTEGFPYSIWKNAVVLGSYTSKTFHFGSVCLNLFGWIFNGNIFIKGLERVIFILNLFNCQQFYRGWVLAAYTLCTVFE